jgi:predicted nucleic acid-binding Zn ribbon protein
MPTYEFRCPDGTIIERVFKMSEVPESIPTPDSTGVAVRMISGGADLLFKGSGFYITDYGKDGKKDQRESANKSAAGDSAKSSSGDSAKSAAPAAAPSSTGSSST